MDYKRVAKQWWAEAVNTAVYLINRTTNSNHEAETPFELYFKTKPHVSHLRVISSLGNARIDESKHTNFDSKWFCCRLLGYARNTKGNKVLDFMTGTIKNSRSIAFYEREVSNIYEDDPVDLHPRTIIIRQDDDGGDQPVNSQQDGDEDVEMEDHEIVEDVEMEVPSFDNSISDTSSSQTSNLYIAGSMNTEQHQHNSQVFQQGSRHQELELHNSHDSGAMLFCLQLKRRSLRKHHNRVLTDDANGRSGSGPREGVDEVLLIEQSVQLLLEDKDAGTENSIVPYNENHESGGSDNDEPPSER
uniref:Retroviral polymerase SH3-like domain-containing protein n=1 Tax=Peronospora matthiolae TaxID=2874970 RepID=A0AAV1V8F1_9STRA